MNEAQKTPGKWGPKWLLPVLILSLAANLFVVGAVGGIALRGGPPGVGDGLGPHPRMGPGALLRALPEEAREKARAVMGPRRAEMRAARQRVHAARRGVFDVLSAEDYTAERLETAFAELRKAEADAAVLGQGLVLALAETLSPEERIAAAHAVRDRLKKRFKKPRRWGQEDPPQDAPAPR